MDFIYAICPPGILSQILVGLSRTVILFIVASGLTLILGVLRIPNVAHGSLYMIGAFMAFTISRAGGRRNPRLLAGPRGGAPGCCCLELHGRAGIVSVPV